MIVNHCKIVRHSSLLRRFYSIFHKRKNQSKEGFDLVQILDFASLKVLGIETSCDDTSAAIVNCEGSILGQGHFSQARFHVETGGILPNVASDFHKEYIKTAVELSVQQSSVDFKDLDAIAVTVKPGLILSLEAGVEYAKELCILYKKPLIPIHHMEAHALTARLSENVKFPFLTLLISGGHCLLALVKSVDKFYILGSSVDNAPGQVLDKLARRAKLQNLPSLRGLVGGVAIERAALQGSPSIIFPNVFQRQTTCNFSFSGLFTYASNYIQNKEKTLDLEPDEVIPDINDLCASYQLSIALHLCRCLENAFCYVHSKVILTEKCLVVAGGVASNQFICKALKLICNEYEYEMKAPPPSLCCDNGVMIAWNGIERLKENLPVVSPENLNTVVPIARTSLGENISKDVNKVLQTLSVTHVKQNLFTEKLLDEKKDSI